MLVEENKKIKFILASASPRRSDIFSLLKLDFDVLVPEDAEEGIFDSPVSTVLRNSLKKTEAAKKY
ncbi:MAG: Maf family protein, partial [Pelovirga sp.]